MTYKKIEELKEIRKWITQIGVPGLMVTLYLWNDPNFRAKAKTNFDKIKTKTKNIFHKNEKTESTVTYTNED